MTMKRENQRGRVRRAVADRSQIVTHNSPSRGKAILQTMAMCAHVEDAFRRMTRLKELLTVVLGDNGHRKERTVVKGDDGATREKAAHLVRAWCRDDRLQESRDSRRLLVRSPSQGCLLLLGPV